MSDVQGPQEGVLYTLRQAVEAKFFGDDVTVVGLRKAIKKNGLPHTRRYGGKIICLSKQDIEAIQALGLRGGGDVSARQTARRQRRTPASAAASSGAPSFRPRPEARRRAS